MNYNSVKLEKGMYGVRGKNFTQVLEDLDPSAGYKNSAFNGLDAYQRQLKRFGIKVSGPYSDSVSKFFSTTDSSALFPEFVSRAVKAGMEEFTALSAITASTTNADSPDYRSFNTVDSGESPAQEGAALPELNVKTKSNLVQMKKHGRLLSASYEAVKFQRLDLFAVILRRIGQNIARAQMQDAVNVLLNGDGNGNAPEEIGAAGAALAFEDLLALWSSFDDYDMTAILAAPATVMEIAALDEFLNPLNRVNLLEGGKLGEFAGTTGVFKSAYVPEGTVIGLDSGCALEKVECGGLAIDYDKLIDRQLERAGITSTAGFARIFDGAVKILTI
ncbi:MAG: phage major capsid protein [Oscillospiraceae bacterium]|jgi:hypothetical protein|nr:phage major capsid protein [Oscillospiraceae bacterium]